MCKMEVQRHHINDQQFMFLSWKTCLFCPLEGGILSNKIPTSSSGAVRGGILVENKGTGINWKQRFKISRNEEP